MKLSLTVNKSDIYKLQAALMDRGRFLSNKMLNASVAVAEDIMRESVSQVPVVTGALANSAFIEQDKQGVRFGYGGNNVQVNPNTGRVTSEYMVVVHEDLTAHHITGKAKFLEDPINDALIGIESKLGQATKG